MILLKTIYQPQYVELIELLIQTRKSLPLTQSQLATILGKQQSYIAKVEICERKLDVLEFIDWSRALGLEPSDLIKQIEGKYIWENKADKWIFTRPLKFTYPLIRHTRLLLFRVNFKDFLIVFFRRHIRRRQ